VARAHRRPEPEVAAGPVARAAGASAMLDVSDGLAVDLRRLAAASSVGVVVDDLPVADGATDGDAIGGGDDYALLLAAPDPAGVAAAFAAAGLAPPLVIGRCTDDPTERRLGDGDLPEGGWEHAW
jgi:thiamine-monophosphate kinase